MNITIIGLGVIGGSFAMGLKEAGVEKVYGVDINQDTLDIALDKKIIQKGFTDAKDVLPFSDLVIITLYPKQIVSFFKEHLPHFKKNSVITDVTGIKTPLVENIRPLLHEEIDFIFAHPMRGSEKAGIEGADHTRFIGANALLTPIPENKEKNIKLVEELYRKIGFNLLTRVSYQTHDEQIAYVSQLMHVLSVSAVNSPQSTHDTMLFAGNSFLELIRIADVNGPLWAELFLNNREELIKAMDNFDAEFQKLKQAVIDDDSEELKRIFEKSSKQRKEWYEFF